MRESNIFRRCDAKVGDLVGFACSPNLAVALVTLTLVGFTSQSYFVLNNVLLIVAGTLVGASGSGKTSLANLLPRFYHPTGGRILLDGQEPAKAAEKWLKANPSVWEPWLAGVTTIAGRGSLEIAARLFVKSPLFRTDRRAGRIPSEESFRVVERLQGVRNVYQKFDRYVPRPSGTPRRSGPSMC